MQQIPNEKQAVSGGPDATPKLGGGHNKIERIAEESKGLFEDLKEWAELKIKLTRLEVETEIEARAAEAKVAAVAGAVGLLGAVFGLVALALGLGAWLGHPAWGFLAVTLLLLLTAGVLWYSKGPNRRDARKEVVVEKQEASPPAVVS